MQKLTMFISCPGIGNEGHAAAAAITSKLPIRSLLVVSSSGRVTYFRKGRIVYSLCEKSAGRALPKAFMGPVLDSLFTQNWFLGRYF